MAQSQFDRGKSAAGSLQLAVGGRQSAAINKKLTVHCSDANGTAGCLVNRSDSICCPYIITAITYCQLETVDCMLLTADFFY